MRHRSTLAVRRRVRYPSLLRVLLGTKKSVEHSLRTPNYIEPFVPENFCASDGCSCGIGTEVEVVVSADDRSVGSIEHRLDLYSDVARQVVRPFALYLERCHSRTLKHAPRQRRHEPPPELVEILAVRKGHGVVVVDAHRRDWGVAEQVQRAGHNVAQSLSVGGPRCRGDQTIFCDGEREPIGLELREFAVDELHRSRISLLLRKEVPVRKPAGSDDDRVPMPEQLDVHPKGFNLEVRHVRQANREDRETRPRPDGTRDRLSRFQKALMRWMFRTPGAALPCDNSSVRATNDGVEGPHLAETLSVQTSPDAPPCQDHGVAKRRPSSPGAGEDYDSTPELAVAPDLFREQLRARIAIGEELLNRNVTSPVELKALVDDTYIWDEYNTAWLKKSFSTALLGQEYSGYAGPLVMGGRDTLAAKLRDEATHIDRKLRRLRTLDSSLELYLPTANEQPPTTRSGTDIFIVHGRDESVKQATARFVETLCPERSVVILHEQPSRSRTIIEKLEDHSESVDFAVVLLTADDEGGLRGSDAMQPRARQNVLFELGLFIGRLGRGRVAVLYEEGVELLSDLSGLAYIPVDAAGAWRMLLAREIKAAGIAINAEALLK